MPAKPAHPHGLPPAESKAALWQRENRKAIEAWNSHVEEHGLPLAEYTRSIQQ